MKANEIYDAMPGTLQLASAAQMDLGQSADIVSNILTAYGMSAKDLGRVNDVLVKGFTSTNIDLSMLAESMKYAAPVAKGLGIEIEGLTAMIGLMGNAGIQGSDAGTALRAGLTRLIKPPKDAAASLKELNIATTTAKGEMLPIVDILGDLEKSFVGMGNAEREAHMAKIFGLQHGSKWSAMMAQGNDKLKEQITLLQNSGGAAKEVADVQMQGLNGAIKALKSAFEGLMIAIGDTGLLTDITNIAKKITEFVQGLTKTNPTIMKFAFLFGLVVAAIGPLLVVIGTLIGAIGTIASAIATIGAPIAIAIAAIGALVMGITGGAAALKLGFIDLGSSTQIVQDKFAAFKEKAIEVFNNFKDLALTVFTFFRDQILPVLTEGFKEILPIVQDIMTGTIELIGTLVNYAKFAFGILAPYIKVAWELIVNIIKGALTIIQGIINIFVSG
jgi:TP901 family phage tail tape measure protein